MFRSLDNRHFKLSFLLSWVDNKDKPESTALFGMCKRYFPSLCAGKWLIMSYCANMKHIPKCAHVKIFNNMEKLVGMDVASGLGCPTDHMTTNCWAAVTLVPWTDAFKYKRKPRLQPISLNYHKMLAEFSLQFLTTRPKFGQTCNRYITPTNMLYGVKGHRVDGSYFANRRVVFFFFFYGYI